MTRFLEHAAAAFVAILMTAASFNALATLPAQLSPAAVPPVLA